MKINGPLVAEMFNILCFHVASKSFSEDDIMQFYKRERSSIEKEKEEAFEVNENLNLLDNLTARDKRMIERSEEEWSQTQHFSRLLPSETFSR